ncbi:mediator of RNA polymerase II transcription subunit 20 [Sipha flava]|uniref:Mediator of RNA polymerase II transcription subunit 20 n=1 Tax=Sipha flava TaxID=143950 RepID=A0A2S2QW52_9HEMI|nr:mediator of RNA polymerase II transcription subunit 20 [Sipha flava]
MGVTILQQFPMKENRTGAQIIEFLTKRVNALGAKQCGTFLVDCETYASIPQLGTQRTLHVFHNSEQPASVFAILDNGNGKTVPVVADGLFDLLLMKMSSVYTSKKSKVEIRGPRFELNDFVIKIGAININHNVKGIIVEAEYRPCVVFGLCWDMLREFLQGFLGSCVSNVPPHYFQNRTNDIFQPLDTIQQYLDHITIYKKATGVLQQYNNTNTT